MNRKLFALRDVYGLEGKWQNQEVSSCHPRNTQKKKRKIQAQGRSDGDDLPVCVYRVSEVES